MNLYYRPSRVESKDNVNWMSHIQQKLREECVTHVEKKRCKEGFSRMFSHRENRYPGIHVRSQKEVPHQWKGIDHVVKRRSDSPGRALNADLLYNPFSANGRKTALMHILKVAVIVMVTKWPQKITFFEDRMNF